MVDTAATFVGTLNKRILRGFTLIEMMVVLGVISVIATIAFYGLSQYNNTQPLFNAQKELLTTFRSVQNQVNNGSDGVSVKAVILNPSACDPTMCRVRTITSYLGSSLTFSDYYLPKGVIFNVTTQQSICFSNPNLTSFSTSQKCVINGATGESCSGSGASDLVGYICTTGTPTLASSPSSYTLTLTQGTAQKTIILEGAGMKINRIYAP